jgi:hypothetical protein
MVSSKARPNLQLNQSKDALLFGPTRPLASLRKNSLLLSILGGAAVYRCGK